MSERPLPRRPAPATGARPFAKARLLVISGPSGAGKTSVATRLLEDPRFARVVTATTRPPRGEERDGVDYIFLSPDAFLRGIERGEFLEHAEVYGHRYGTPRSEPERILASGRHCILVLDVQGARELRRLGVDGCYVFVQAPDEEELARRLQGRGHDDAAVIRERLREARREAEASVHFDEVLVNDDIEETVRRLAELLDTEFAPREAEGS